MPEPKKPVIMVAGMRLSGGILVETSESSLCGVVVAVADTENRRQRLALEKLEVEIIVRGKEDVVLEERDWGLMALGLNKRGRTVVLILESGGVRWWWRLQRVVKLMKVVAMSIDSVAICLLVGWLVSCSLA